jgi:hypothetical protein
VDAEGRYYRVEEHPTTVVVRGVLYPLWGALGVPVICFGVLGVDPLRVAAGVGDIRGHGQESAETLGLPLLDETRGWVAPRPMPVLPAWPGCPAPRRPPLSTVGVGVRGYYSNRSP